MTIETRTSGERILRPAAAASETRPAPGAFSAERDPRLEEMRTGGALGTSMLVLYPVFACAIVVLTSLTMAGPAMPL